MSTPLLIEESDDRIHATLNRPSARNAIDQDMIDALHGLCEELEERPKVLILSGAGAGFAAGADIRQLRDRRAEDARKGINTTAFRRVRRLPMPVIAALHGHALGGGAELAYAADIRIGTPDVIMGNPEPGLGIIAAAGATWRLPQIVGEARAADLLLTGRMIRAEEALQWGLISEIHPAEDLLPAAHRIADRILRNDPLATQHTKRAMLAGPDEHPAIELELQAELFESPEKFRRMTAFIERSSRERSADPA